MIMASGKWKLWSLLSLRSCPVILCIPSTPLLTFVSLSIPFSLSLQYWAPLTCGPLVRILTPAQTKGEREGGREGEREYKKL